MQKSQQTDYERYFKEKGDDGFSPARNKAIIDSTIKSYEAYLKRKEKERDENLSERSHLVASYIKSLAMDTGRPIDQYVSRRYLAKLRGEEVLEELRSKINIV